MELDLFCMTVSSATAHDYIHQRMQDMDKYVFGINKRQQKAKEKAAQAANGGQGQEAVSYTHLRAHET